MARHMIAMLRGFLERATRAMLPGEQIMKPSLSLIHVASIHRSASRVFLAEAIVVLGVVAMTLLTLMGVSLGLVDWVFAGGLVLALVLQCLVVLLTRHLLRAMGERGVDLLPAILFSAMPLVGLFVAAGVLNHARASLRRRVGAVGVLGLSRERILGLPTDCCPKCWYDMQGLAAATCPECGLKMNRTPVRTTTAGRVGDVSST